jgi:hypothetical protein
LRRASLHMQRSLQNCLADPETISAIDDAAWRRAQSLAYCPSDANQIRVRKASRGLAMRRDRPDQSLRHLRFAVALAEIILLASWLTIGLAPSAQALPSFARQTGQPCGTCHTDYPALTPFGRRFKLLGYTTGGGQFRTTPFSSNEARDVQAEYNKLLNYAEPVKAPPQPLVDANSRDWVPPISAMAIIASPTRRRISRRRRTLSIPTTTSCIRHSACSGAVRSRTTSARSRR